jgi:hypothetical protein
VRVCTLCVCVRVRVNMCVRVSVSVCVCMSKCLRAPVGAIERQCLGGDAEVGHGGPVQGGGEELLHVQTRGVELGRERLNKRHNYV